MYKFILFVFFWGQTPAPIIRMRQYDESGSLVNTQELLKEHGFEVDCHVSRKDGVLARIKAFEDGTSHVLLSMSDPKGGNKVMKVEAASFLKGQWTKYQPKALPQFLEKWWEPSCLEHKDSKVAFVKAKILVELRAAMRGSCCQQKPHALMVRMKPGKGVVCAVKFGKGQLKLFPFTNRIDTGKAGDGTVLVTTVGDMEFHLRQSTGITVPFWHVAVVNDASVANMEIVNMPAKKHDGLVDPIKIPYMRNIAPVEPETELLIYKAPSKTRVNVESLDHLIPTKRLRAKEKC